VKSYTELHLNPPVTSVINYANDTHPKFQAFYVNCIANAQIFTLTSYSHLFIILLTNSTWLCCHCKCSIQHDYVVTASAAFNMIMLSLQVQHSTIQTWIQAEMFKSGIESARGNQFQIPTS